MSKGWLIRCLSAIIKLIHLASSRASSLRHYGRHAATGSCLMFSDDEMYFSYCVGKLLHEAIKGSQVACILHLIPKSISGSNQRFPSCVHSPSPSPSPIDERMQVLFPPPASPAAFSIGRSVDDMVVNQDPCSGIPVPKAPLPLH